MQALTLISTSLSMPGFQALPEKVQTLSKASVLALPLLAIAGATYLAPVPLLFAGAGLCYLSAKAVQKALSGTLPDREQAIQMIVGALLITGITLGGLTLGLAPVSLSMMITAFQASSFGALLTQLACGAFCLTAVTGFGGEWAREAFNNANALSLEKLQNYFDDLKKNPGLRRPEDNKTEIEYFFLAFRKTLGEYFFRLQTDKLPNSLFYLIQKDEIFVIINQIIHKISEDVDKYHHLDSESIELMVSNTLTRLEKLSQILVRMPEPEQKELMEHVVRNLEALENIPELQEIYQQFKAPYQWIFDAKLSLYLTESPERTIAEIKTFVVEMEKAFAEKKKTPFSSEQFYELQTLASQKKGHNNFLAALYPDRQDLKGWGEELSDLIKRFELLAAKLCDVQNQDLANQIDYTEPVWNLLVSNAGSKEQYNQLIAELKQLLKVSQESDFDAKMDEIGLATVKDLFDKKIISKDDYGNHVLVQQKVLHYINKVTHLDIQDIALQCIFRVSIAFSLLAPLAVSPLLSILGAVAGLIGFGYHAVQNDEALTFHKMWVWLGEKRDRLALSLFMRGLARRTLSGSDQFTQNDSRRFVDADFFGKMRIVTKEFLCATWLITLAKIKIFAIIILPVLGAMLAREAMEHLYAWGKKYYEQKIPLPAPNNAPQELSA